MSEGTLVPCSLACEESKVSLEELGDVIDYMMDCFCSLQAFLTIFPKACETFHEKDFELRYISSPFFIYSFFYLLSVTFKIVELR